MLKLTTARAQVLLWWLVTLIFECDLCPQNGMVSQTCI